ncbi:Flp family type IVb pilin [Hamadaea tsunoensis]|uniref:Flp family type IVb pilin n=1 Tax=Hamadaea tsunoensis TaxID=53368 RepID=UPI00040DE8EB|nr:Flp family type IVb pilin [Hamadaea tsunoensis]
MLKLAQKARALRAKKDQGATAVEYGLIVALIVVAIVVAVGTLGTNLSNKFDCVAQTVGDGKAATCK